MDVHSGRCAAIHNQADFLIHYNLLVDVRSRCLRDMRTGLAIAASLSSIKPLSLNRVDTVQNEYTKLLGQFPELTRPTTKGEPVKHGITHKIVSKGHRSVNVAVIPGFSDTGGCGRPPRFRTLVTGAHN